MIRRLRVPKSALDRDWLSWHEVYDRDSAHLRRLRVVRDCVRRTLDFQIRGPIQVLALCAGQGRDLLPVMAAHRRRLDIRARLVELDPGNVLVAIAAAEELGLTGLEIVEGDASLTASFEGAVPANIILACGIFGWISDKEILHTIEQLPTLCAPQATIVWTDHRDTVRRWFSQQGFEELAFQGEPGRFGVGVHRLTSDPKPFDPRVKLFTFGTTTPRRGNASS